MVNDQRRSRRGDHPRPRTRIERRLVVLGVATVLVLVIPGLRAVVVDLFVDLVMLIVVLGLAGLFALVIVWRALRRHPIGDLILGAWLLRRHERRQQQIVDARSWYGAPQPYEAQGWETGTRRRGW